MTPKNPKAVQHLHSITINDEWGTESEIYFYGLNISKITPKLDVCATDDNAVLDNYFTKKQNGLLQEWNQDFFMNPPYSEITLWMEKAYNEHKKHNVNGLILVYAKTDTKWWHKYVEGIAEVHFIKGRLKFVTPEGELSKNSAPYPSCWIIYRRKEDAA